MDKLKIINELDYNKSINLKQLSKKINYYDETFFKKKHVYPLINEGLVKIELKHEYSITLTRKGLLLKALIKLLANEELNEKLSRITKIS